jgi:cold shock CspA family protein
MEFEFGTCARVGHEGRYYFIAPAAGGVEVFAHRNNVFGGTLKVGDKVRYMLRRSTHRRDKFEAYDVAGLHWNGEFFELSRRQQTIFKMARRSVVAHQRERFEKHFFDRVRPIREIRNATVRRIANECAQLVAT